MNRVVVGLVAVGLAEYILGRDPGATAAGVVVGYDGRANSSVFALDVARILSRAGIRVALLPAALPTPVLAFAVRQRGAAYGVMVTASHNPREYNGVKVYVRDGGQLLPPEDEAIAAAIDGVDPLELPSRWSSGAFEFEAADDSVAAYVESVGAGGGSGTVGGPGIDWAEDRDKRRLRVVYTPLHGVGEATFRAALAAAGWPAPIPVPSQQRPDPGFPTVPYPNPEEPGVLDRARKAAERVCADLVVAHDPDADRLAVMVADYDGWRMLTGDELGALLGYAVLSRLEADARGAAQGGAEDGEWSPVVATTVVSGSLLRRMAQGAGVTCVTTLTGFKWIARAGGASHELIYGYEQALGYAVRPDLVADKDGISAALLVMQLAASEARRGRTLLHRLNDLYLDHGLHVTGQRTLRADGAAGLARLADAVARVRKEPPRLLAGRAVTVTDLLDGAGGVVDLAGGRAERSPGEPVPTADVLVWHAGDDARVMIRPSGTEPVLKIYAEAAEPVRGRVLDSGPLDRRTGLVPARAAARERVAALLAAAVAALNVEPSEGESP